MKVYKLVVILLVQLLCIFTISAQQGNMDWTQATANAGWSGRERHTSVVFDNKIWVMGGGSYPNYYNDVWYSSDGVNWTQTTANAGWSARECHTSVGFDNKIWVMGGFDAGGRRNDVWYSSDGVNWTQATANAGWSVRGFHTSVVFDNKMWVMGGYDIISNCTNDVWYSTDGINWTCATANAGWSGRVRHTSVVFDNKMWVIGGQDASYNYRNDVWYSRGRITTLLIPNGGEFWAGGSIQIIKWRTIGSGFARYRLVLSTNGGANYPDMIAHNVAPNETTYNWTVPAINSTTCRVMVQALDAGGAVIVQDASDANFTIQTSVTVVSPNGSEYWTGGSNQIIRWWAVGSGFARYRLLLSRNGGSTYTDTIAQVVAPTETTYNWTVPALNLTTCRIMVQILDADGSVISQDASDGNFTIQTTVTVVSPNGGEILFGGSNYTIRWRTVGSGFAQYRLVLSINGGSSYSDTIAHNIAPTETTFQWQVLPLNWSTCRVMVQILDAAGTIISQDASDGNFTIMTTGIEEIDNLSIPMTCSLFLTSPNPFSRFTEIRYSIPITTKVKITVFNSYGSEVMAIVNNKLNQGRYSVRWDGRDSKGKICPSGIYFYRLVTDEYQTTRKMLMLK